MPGRSGIPSQNLQSPSELDTAPKHVTTTGLFITWNLGTGQPFVCSYVDQLSTAVIASLKKPSACEPTGALLGDSLGQTIA
jgi:hypothetical protein